MRRRVKLKTSDRSDSDPVKGSKNSESSEPQASGSGNGPSGTGHRSSWHGAGLEEETSSASDVDSGIVSRSCSHGNLQQVKLRSRPRLRLFNRRSLPANFQSESVSFETDQSEERSSSSQPNSPKHSQSASPKHKSGQSGFRSLFENIHRKKQTSKKREDNTNNENPTIEEENISDSRTSAKNSPECEDFPEFHSDSLSDERRRRSDSSLLEDRREEISHGGDIHVQRSRSSGSNLGLNEIVEASIEATHQSGLQAGSRAQLRTFHRTQGRRTDNQSRFSIFGRPRSHKTVIKEVENNLTNPMIVGILSLMNFLLWIFLSSVKFGRISAVVALWLWLKMAYTFEFLVKCFHRIFNLDPDKVNQNNDYTHIEGVLRQLNDSRTQLEELWAARKLKLDLCLQLRLFERDAVEVSSQLELWAEELQHQELVTDGNKAEQMLVMHNERVLHMQNCTFEVLQRGQELAQLFETTGVQLMADSHYEAPTRIQELLEYLHEREVDLETLADSKRNRLEQCVQLRNFEVEARQVISWIRNGESMLTASFMCPSSLIEAEQLKKEQEQFMMAIEKTHYSVVQVTHKAEAMVSVQHYNSDLVRAIVDNVTLAWQQLRNHAEERHKLVMASMTWYKTAEQVWSVLESLDRDYKRDEDWCGTDRANISDKPSYMVQLINKHNEQKEAFLKACTLARRTAESFLKYVNRNLHTLGTQMKFRSPEGHVKGFYCFLTRKAPNTTIAEFASTVDPEETAHNEPSHVDLQCLPSSL